MIISHMIRVLHAINAKLVALTLAFIGMNSNHFTVTCFYAHASRRNQEEHSTPSTSEELAEAMGILKSAKVQITDTGLLEYLRAKSLSPRNQQQTTEMLPQLLQQLESKDYRTREAASSALKALSSVALPEMRKTLATNTNPEVQLRLQDCIRAIEAEYIVTLSAIRVLAEHGNESTVSVLLDRLEGAESEMVRAIQSALMKLTIGNLPNQALRAALADPLPIRRAVAAEVLSCSGRNEDQVRILLKDKDAGVRASAALGLAMAGDRSAVRSLINSLKYLPFVEAVEYEEALCKLGGNSSPVLKAGNTSADRQANFDSLLEWWDKNGSSVNPRRLSRSPDHDAIVVWRPFGPREKRREDKILSQFSKSTVICWSRSKTRVTKLEVDGTRITDQELASLIGLQSLAELSLLGTQVTETGFRTLSKLKSLTTLRLHKMQLTDAYLEELAKLNMLTTLQIQGSELPDSGLKTLSKLEQLRSLDLHSTKVTDLGIRELVALKRLTTLSLFNTNVTDSGITEIAKIKTLTSLNLSATELTDAGITEIAKIKTLTSLALRATSLTGTGVKELAQLRNLTEVNFGASLLTDTDLEHIVEFKNLATLDLGDTRVTDVTLAKLAALKRLKVLDLTNTSVTDAGLDNLTKLKSLTSLTLIGTKVTDAGMTSIAKIETLTKLDLCVTKVTDSGLKSLIVLERLTQLELGVTQVSNSGLNELSKFKNLRSINLYNTNVTDTAIVEFKRLNPECAVYKPW